MKEFISNHYEWKPKIGIQIACLEMTGFSYIAFGASAEISGVMFFCGAFAAILFYLGVEIDNGNTKNAAITAINLLGVTVPAYFLVSLAADCIYGRAIWISLLGMTGGIILSLLFPILFGMLYWKIRISRKKRNCEKK